MKKQLLFAVLATLTLSLQAQEKCYIQGKAQGLPDGTILTLSRHNGNLLKRFATDTVRNHSFRFDVLPANQQVEHIMLMGEGEGFPNA